MNKIDKNILYIDTVEYGKVVFVLSKAGKKDIFKSFAVKPNESSNILGYLDKFLKVSKISNPCLAGRQAKSEIRKLVIYKGSGSFTGLRIAAAVFQALSLAWGVKAQVKSKKSAIL